MAPTQMVSLRWLVLLCGVAFASRPNVAVRTQATAFIQLGDLVDRMRQGSADSFAAIQDVEQLSRQMVQRMGNATAHLSDTEITLIKKVIGILRDDMVSRMTGEHNSDKYTLGNLSLDITKCNTDMTAEMASTGTVGQLLTTAKSYQTSYIGTKDDVQTLKNTRDDASSELLEHMTKVGHPDTDACKILPQQDIGLWDVYFDSNTFVQWYKDEQTDYNDERQKLKNAEDNLLAKRKTLAQDETKLRTEYCAFSLVLNGVCDTHDTCHGDEVTAFNTKKTELLSHATNRQKYFAAGSKAIVYLEFLIGESETDTVGDVNTSQFQLTVPDFQAKQACTVTQPNWQDFLASACNSHAATFVDLGAGCCSGWMPVLWHGGQSDSGECQQKCAEYETCGFYSYGWGGSTYCAVFGEAGPCPSLASGPSDCGSSGSNGVHTYKAVKAPCHFQQHDDDIPDGVIVERAGETYWGGCYDRVDASDGQGVKYRHQQRANAEIYKYEEVWRMGVFGEYVAYDAGDIVSDTVPATGPLGNWVRSHDSRTPTGMDMGPAPTVRVVQAGGIVHKVQDCNMCNIQWCGDQSTVHKTEVASIEDAGYVLGAALKSSGCAQLPQAPRAITVDSVIYVIELQADAAR